MRFTDETDLPIRGELANALDNAWARLGQPGTWWTGTQRLAIAAESRKAMSCAVCQERKDALSPFHVTGAHDTLGELSAAAVDAIHRIRTDAGRLTETWVQGLMHQGLRDVEYAEIIGVVATVSAVDGFDRAMGCRQRDLPQAVAGAPTRYRPSAAIPGLGWLDTLRPADLRSEYANPDAGYGADNIHRAISLVPSEVSAFFDLDVELYLCDREFPRRALQAQERAISEAQIEMIAARASSINGCFY